MKKILFWTLLVVACPPASEAAAVGSSAAADAAVANATQENSPDISPVWGVLDQLIGGSWSPQDVSTAAPGTYVTVHKYEWAKNRGEIHLDIRVYGAGATDFNGAGEIRFRPTDEPGVLQAVVKDYNGSRKTLFRVAADGSLVSDWYKPPYSWFFDTGGGGNELARRRISLRNGHYLYERASKSKDDPADVAFPIAQEQPYRRYGAAESKALVASGKQHEETENAAMNAAYEEIRQKEKAEKAARSAERWELFGAVMQSVATGVGATGSSGSSSASGSVYGDVGGYERAQAQMDATVAGIQAQARAEQQAQLRASEQRAAQPSVQHQQARQQHVPQQSSAMRDRSGALSARPAQSAGGTGSWETAGGRSSSATGNASTRDDASTCVSAPVTSRHRCDTLVGYKGMVSNSCSVPVEVRMCFMTATGWNCQRNTLRPQQTWEPGWCHANTGQVFHSVRYTDSKTPLASP